MDEDKALRHFRTGFFAACSAVFGILAYAAAALSTMMLVPRRPEGIRDVTDLPWPIYASLPTLLPLAVLLIVIPLLPNRKSRLGFVLIYTLAVVGSTFLGIDLLRRDYVGEL